MRLAYVCADPGVPVFGRKGASVHVQEVVRAMLAKGIDVDLLAARVGGPPPPGLEQARVHRLPGREPGTGGGSSLEREAAARHAGSSTAVLDGLHGRVDVVYERYSLWGAAAMAWARTAGVPGVLEVNAPLVEEQARHRRLHHRAGAEAVAFDALGAAAAVVAVSQPVADWVARVRPDRAARVTVLANGVDTQRFHPEVSPQGTGGEVCTIGFAGTLKPWHGVDVLAEAFVRLASGDPAYRLLVVGDGPEAPALASRLDSAGVRDRAELTGAVDHCDVPGLLRRMDIGVAPYPPTAGYFSPLKLYEYLAAGLPVVASKVGQIPEVVEDGRTGVLCPPGDVAALAAAVDGLRCDPPRAAALGRGARAAVERDHTWPAVVDRILALARRAGPVPAGVA